jgi:hypothetical protein
MARKTLAILSLASVGLASGPELTAQLPDLTVGRVQTVQVLQNNPPVLVAGRPVFVRASVRITNPPASPLLADGLMRVFVDGVETAESPIYSDNGPFVVPLVPSLGTNENDTLNFIFVAPPSGDVLVSVEINPAGPNFVPESDTSNNTLASTSTPTEQLGTAEFAYVPVDYRPGGGEIPNLPPLDLIEPGVGDNFIQAIYPGALFEYHRTDVPSKLHTTSLSGSGSSLLSALTVDISLMSPPPENLYGWIPGSLPYNGQSIIGQPVSMGNTQNIRHQRTYAHEVGHNTGLFHNSLKSLFVGIDVEHHLNLTEGLAQLLPSTQNDIMVPGLLTPQAWVSPTNYNYFRNHAYFDPGTDQDLSVATEPQVLVTGLWNRDTGAVQVLNILEVPEGLPTQSDGASASSIAVTTYRGSQMAHEVLMAVRDSTDESCADADSAFSPSPEVAFAALVPPLANGQPIDRLVIAPVGDVTMAALSIERSPAAPTVSFTSPTTSPLTGNTLLVSWEASDADGDELTYYLRYSPDGTRFSPLASGIQATEWLVDFHEVPAPVDGSGFFEVIASDGLNSTTARSEALTGSTLALGVGGNAPWVHIMHPDNGFTFRQGATVILHSSGWDLEDRSLSGASIEWSSDVDGPLGTGRRTTVADLSPGTHAITVTATDSGSLQTIDTATISITPRNLPDTSGNICQADIGFGGPGSSVLSMCGGDLSTGTTANLVLTGAASSAPTFLFIGLVNSPTPVQGGQLVPVPWTFLFGTTTDASGTLLLPNLPGGGGPFSAYLQAVTVDGSLPFGYGFSNAIQADYLP